MPIIFFKEESNALDLEPYKSFSKKLDDKMEAGLDGSRIKINIGMNKEGFSEGFDISRYYSDEIVLTFSFVRNPNATCNEETYFIHHMLEYDFNSSFSDIERGALEEISKRARFFYVEGAAYSEFAYRLVGTKKAEMQFDILTSENDVRKVCYTLISHDIAIFSRGW